MILTACNSSASVPTTSPTDAMGTAISIVKTEALMTQAAIPTVTPVTPTIIPPDAYLGGQASSPSADQLDHAMATAPKIYTLLPYINSATPYGEYSGCTENYDFHNYVVYAVMLPMETVNTAFLDYFQTERWEFTEAISGPVGNPTITYDVYRISSKDRPAFERLTIVLVDESTLRGENYINVRAELTYIETKENLRYLLDPLTCYNNRAWWMWIRLTK